MTSETSAATPAGARGLKVIDALAVDPDGTVVGWLALKFCSAIPSHFAEAPAHVIRLGLQSEVERVRGWPASLESEAEKPLHEFGKAIDASSCA